MQYFMRINLHPSRVKADVSQKKEAILSGVTVTWIVNRGVTVAWTSLCGKNREKEKKLKHCQNYFCLYVVFRKVD